MGAVFAAVKIPLPAKGIDAVADAALCRSVWKAAAAASVETARRGKGVCCVCAHSSEYEIRMESHALLSLFR
jgi:hypothetical protein